MKKVVKSKVAAQKWLWWSDDGKILQFGCFCVDNMDHESLGFLAQYPTRKPAKYLLCDSIAALVRKSLTQNVFRSTLNFVLSCYEILKISNLT